MTSNETARRFPPAQGIHFLPVSHTGCSQKSAEEGRTIKEYFQKLMGQKFVDKDGSARLMTTADILVVSPYNVQVNHLRSILPARARVGTVDKFQGQEAPVVLVSMATSDAEWLPRDIEFLFSANRLNVALSRAQCLAVVAASPKLLETPCKTINQLRLVNKFCQLVEFAAGSGKGSPLALPNRDREDRLDRRVQTWTGSRVLVDLSLTTHTLGSDLFQRHG